MSWGYIMEQSSIRSIVFLKITILIFLAFALSFMLAGCNFISEQKEKSITKDYYNALIEEDYEEAFEKLYLYDYNENKHATEGTLLNKKEAKEFYMQKINYLKEQKYKVKDFEIQNIRYEDGHTFFLEIILNVEKNGEGFEYSETVDVWEGKAWILEEDDPFAVYRDGTMNFDIKKEIQEDGA